MGINAERPKRPLARLCFKKADGSLFDENVRVLARSESFIRCQLLDQTILEYAGHFTLEFDSEVSDNDVANILSDLHSLY